MKKAINFLEIAKNNFALDIANGESFAHAVESGALMLDTDEELAAYAKFCADWKTGKAKVTVEKYDCQNERFHAVAV